MTKTLRHEVQTIPAQHVSPAKIPQRPERFPPREIVIFVRFHSCISKQAMSVLDEDHHGLKDVKGRILQFIVVDNFAGRWKERRYARQARSRPGWVTRKPTSV